MKTINILKSAALVVAIFVTSAVQNATAQGDNCGVATPITPGTYTGTTVGASPEVQPFCGTGDGTGGGVWYSIQGGSNCMQFTASLCTNTSFDSKIRVFEGTCGALTCVTGIDDFCGLQSEVSWVYTPGVTYYILVHGFSTDEGAFELNVTESFGDNTAPVPTPGIGTTDQAALTNNTCMAQFSQTDVAQSFVPTQNTMCGAGIELASAGSGDLTLQLWDALPNAGGSLLAQGTTTYTSATWIDVTWASVSIIPGNTYYLVATSTSGGDCWAGDTGNGYAGGMTFANAGYGAFSGFDYVFATYYGCGLATLPDVNSVCAVANIVAPTATDVCAGLVTGTPDVTFPINASTVVTWTYDDGNGNTSTQTQNVNITDAIAPVADVASLNDELAECSATPVAPTATDNCAGAVTATPDVTFPITTQGTTLVTWTYDDGNGNTSIQTQNVIIADVTAPVADVASLSDELAECTATPVAPTATDNCMGVITATPDVTFPITTQGTTLVTWTYDDGYGNTSTQTQNVIIADVTAPVADVASLNDELAECTATPVAPTATDNCMGAITATPDVTFPITTQGTTLVTWTYDDGYGNISTQTQNVILADATAPVADVATLSDESGVCDVTPTAPTATDNCAGALTATPDVTLPISAVGTTVVTWTYDDGNGNTSTQTQNVIVSGVDTGVTQTGATLTADAAGMTYQWLDCDNAYAIIAGETNAAFTPTNVVGNYAVEVNDNGCVDTSACFLVDYTGIEELVVLGVSVYPNPTSGQFTVDFEKVNVEALKIVDARGRVVYEVTNIMESKVEVNISDENPGIYYLQIFGEFGTAIEKVVLN